jgi:flagellar motor switch/type III secretory pathway protein FliN
MVETLLVTKILKDLIVMVAPGQHVASSTVLNPQMKDEQREVPDDINVHKGSGAVMAKIEDRDWSCDLLLSHGIAQHLTGAGRPKTARTGLTSRKTVIGHGKIALRVTAGEIELSLSDLLDLKPGHVMRLSQKIDQPFALETVDTQTRICAAYLGQRDGNKAIQLINQ